ncbi:MULTISPECIES: toxin-antitoxin system HicB family antitoxin [unclassified Caballeronia]|uniref:toxin-antitoxin system HicB family antitoxin n=1 Tax=unclassified Caballeronia TaxID=2646786 RepID=UPI00285FAD52|nr:MULTISPECIES: toxin-antitoxin system HicB family antitoxin [unclassified Caballeronia]MDR5777372.1 toxin-antitoxin system HicB family antitoxin [Caballeronia sp. LZ002]MDR5802543.1 toxin-antitoxin system HicB family antitoxin [Caballeronia sp. LZ001]MDR5852810.1 toxin-antitoxin system HicB family antitoxin [Caballeronia sp. LZ003]
MPADDQENKTTLRMPPELHAAITHAADAAGSSFNAEVTLRLRHDPHKDATSDILEAIRQRDTQLTDSLMKHNGILWSGLGRAAEVLDRVAHAPSRVSGESEAGSLRREVEIARQLLSVISAHK